MEVKKEGREEGREGIEADLSSSSSPETFQPFLPLPSFLIGSFLFQTPGQSPFEPVSSLPSYFPTGSEDPPSSSCARVVGSKEGEVKKGEHVLDVKSSMRVGSLGWEGRRDSGEERERW